MFKNVVVIKI